MIPAHHQVLVNPILAAHHLDNWLYRTIHLKDINKNENMKVWMWHRKLKYVVLCVWMDECKQPWHKRQAKHVFHTLSVSRNVHFWCKKYVLTVAFFNKPAVSSTHLPTHLLRSMFFTIMFSKAFNYFNNIVVRRPPFLKGPSVRWSVLFWGCSLLQYFLKETEPLFHCVAPGW